MEVKLEGEVYLVNVKREVHDDTAIEDCEEITDAVEDDCTGS